MVTMERGPPLVPVFLSFTSLAMFNHDNTSLVALLHNSKPLRVFLYMLGSVHLPVWVTWTIMSICSDEILLG